MGNYGIFFDDRRKTAEAIDQGRKVMARQGDTLIAALVDRSGSMATCREDMERGLNDFITEQRGRPGGAAVTLAQFDHTCELIWPIQDIVGAPQYRLNPRGRTALHDAIGEFVSDVAEMISSDSIWRKVIVVIVTDGAENCSREWDQKGVAELIASWRDGYQWEFVFLGANIDAVKTAAGYGIPADSALTFSTKAAQASYRVLSQHVSTMRAEQIAAFSEQDRRKAIGR